MVNQAAAGALASMTGYAAREGAADGQSWSWELRAVNARGLDLRLRLPDGLGALEAPLRKRLSARIARGAVTLTLRMGRRGGAALALPDAAALTQALDALAQVSEAAAAKGVELRAPSAVDILGMRGLAEAGEAPGLPPVDLFLSDADPLIEAFCAMRLAEGAALAEILAQQIDTIAALTEAAAEAAAARAQTQEAAFREAVARLTEATDLDPARLAQEVAQLAVKSDVVEEIDRLRAHVQAARDLLAAGGPVGRKLDFLMQEFNREANTLCSKSGDTALTAVGLDLKLAVDQTREQVQNLE